MSKTLTKSAKKTLLARLDDLRETLRRALVELRSVRRSARVSQRDAAARRARTARALMNRVDDALIYVGTAATLEQARHGVCANKRTWALILAELERRGIKCVDDHLVDFGGAALDGRARTVAALCHGEGVTRGKLATALGWSGVVLYAAIHRARTLGLVTLTKNAAGRTVIRATGA